MASIKPKGRAPVVQQCQDCCNLYNEWDGHECGQISDPGHSHHPSFNKFDVQGIHHTDGVFTAPGEKIEKTGSTK